MRRLVLWLGVWVYWANAQCTRNDAVNLARSCGAGANQQCSSALSSGYAGDSFPSGNCFDGSTGNFCHDACGGSVGWVRVDLGSTKTLWGGYLWNRAECCQFRTNGFQVWAGSSSSTYNAAGNTNCFTAASNVGDGYFTCNVAAQHVFIVTPSGCLNIGEIAIYPCQQCAAGTYMSAGSCVSCGAGGCI
jgi:hypothetical protein